MHRPAEKQKKKFMDAAVLDERLWSRNYGDAMEEELEAMEEEFVEVPEVLVNVSVIAIVMLLLLCGFCGADLVCGGVVEAWRASA